MKIAIVGAGITGLTAAYEISKKGHQVVVFEKTEQIGGLSACTKIGDTYIEQFYHHLFESDQAIIKLTADLGLAEKLKFFRAKTGIFSAGQIYPFSSPFDLLRYSPLSFFDRLRCGIVFGSLKLWPFPFSTLDRISAQEWTRRYAGKNVYEKIWGPLLEGKFADSAQTIPALWLWGRVRDRSLKLGYFDGSVKILFDSLTKSILRSNGTIKLGCEVVAITAQTNGVVVAARDSQVTFDKVLLTTVSPQTAKLLKNNLPDSSRNRLTSIDHLGVVCALVELKYPIQSQYWLNICQKRAPVLVMIEHTNLIDKEHYGNKSIVYLANYLYRSDQRFSEPDEAVIRKYLGFLGKLNHHFRQSWVLNVRVFRHPHAQTIFKTGFLNRKPSVKTPLPNLFLANIDQMYPHDRNLNQGVLLAQKAVNLMLEK